MEQPTTNLDAQAYLYVNKKDGRKMVSLSPWKTDGTEKWPKSWDEFPLVKAETQTPTKE